MKLQEMVMSAPGDAQALARIVDHFNADSGTIHFLGADGLLHLAAATPGMPDVVLTTIRTIPIGKGMAGLAAERKQPVSSCNIQTDKTGDVRPGARATAMAGAIVVPIFKDEAVVGTLGIANRAERDYTDDEIATLMGAAKALACRR